MKEIDTRLLVLLERIANSLEVLVCANLNEKTQAKAPPQSTRGYLSDTYAACSEWARKNGVPTIRARKAIAKAGIMSFDQVTRERLQGLKNCGEATIESLLKWAELKSKQTGLS